MAQHFPINHFYRQNNNKKKTKKKIATQELYKRTGTLCLGLWEGGGGGVLSLTGRYFGSREIYIKYILFI